MVEVHIDPLGPEDFAGAADCLPPEPQEQVVELVARRVEQRLELLAGDRHLLVVLVRRHIAARG